MADVIVYVEEAPKGGYVPNIICGNYHIGGYQEYIKDGEVKTFLSDGKTVDIRVAGDIKVDLINIREKLFKEYENLKGKRPFKARKYLNACKRYDDAILAFIDKVDEFKRKNPEGNYYN